MTTVETDLGTVRGREKDGVLLFAGIPYAAPPTAQRRFRAPEPHAGWRGVRDALKFSAAAPQVPTGGLTSSTAVRWDEDCLTLNVTTPATDAERRPVLVWLHGGGYRTGQGAIPWYNGASFARGGVVVVSVNYRLGALGFTDLSRFGAEYADSGAAGTLDQIAALRWVRDNIHAFGGDPQQVTLAGESAGAFSVATLLASPRSQGLFQRAIAQSGAAHHTLPAAAANRVTDELLKVLAVDSPLALEALAPEAILSAQQTVAANLREGAGLRSELGVAVSAFYPAQGTSAVPVPPIDAIAAGAGADVALLTGSNRDETTLWGYGDVDDNRLQHVADGFGAAAVLPVYRAERPSADASELLIALTTDHMFRVPAIRLLEARQPHTPDHWMYWFCWPSRGFDGRLGATHALEIPFAFNNLEQPGVDVFLGPGARPQALAERMHLAWLAFVRDGDPGWPRYDLDERPTMRFDASSDLVFDPDANERAAWDGLR